MSTQANGNAAQANGNATGILGVDVGGTFTDGLLLDPVAGDMRWSKVPTTPEDQSEGTLATMPAMGVDVSDLALFCHGTTVGINAFLQRRGAKTGLICTEGMREMLDIGGFTRHPSGLYDPQWTRPHQERPIVHRRHIREVSARMLFDGGQHVALDENQVRRELEFLRDEGVESIAICLLHSYVKLDDEERIAELVREVLPDCYIQYSAVRPVVGEYARTTAVVLDAYTGPVVARYLRRLDARLRHAGYDGPAVIMQMNGGVRTLERTAEHFPAYTMMSGPVAGLLGAEYYAQHFVGVPNLVCIDIGGTSTDLGLVVDGAAQTVPEWEAEWRIALGMPAVDVESIGAGGGSLIQTDEMGTLRVGPESAGAVPGPACYSRGGTEPTITDAHVALGTIRPETFLGGQMTLDVDAARGAISGLGERLAMHPAKLAAGAVQLMNANIESEVSKMVFERGLDIRSFALFAYGGAGPVHAVDVAHRAGISEVIVPRMAGGFSALGLATAPPKVERAMSRVEVLDSFDIGELQGLFAELEEEALDDLAAQGVARDDVTLTRSMSGMYTGQGFSNELPIDEWPLTDEVITRWKGRFDELYDRLYGYSAPEMGVTVTTLSVIALGPRTSLKISPIEEGGAEPPEDAFTGENQVASASGETHTTRYYSREKLLAGNRISGPVVIEDPMTTIVVTEDATAEVDRFGNVRITLEQAADGMEVAR
jgi:N-methylhydantoinase A